MSEILQEEEITTTKRGRRPSAILDLFTAESSQAIRGDVVLRCITAADGFDRTVTCRPGMITVLTNARHNPGFDSYRKALLGRGEVKDVAIRFGQHDLHPSEIHTVIASDVIEPGRTVEEALLLAGVPKQEMGPVAIAVGLNEHLFEKTERAEAKVIARLTTAVAVWSRARIVYLDEPFKDVGSEWAPALAQYLLQSISGSDRVMIIGGVENLPRLWKASPIVELAGGITRGYEDDIEVVDETMGYLRKIQHLIGSSPQDESLITTYPLRIFRRRTPSDAALNIEAICNPNLSQSEQKLYAVTPEMLAAKEQTKEETAQHRRKRKSTHSRLTRVSRLEKIAQTSVVSRIRELLHKPHTDEVQKGTGLATYRIQQYEEEQRNTWHLQIMLLIVLALNAVLLLLNWV